MIKTMRVKVILILGVLTLSTSMFADTKADYEQAIQYSQDNKIEEAVKMLQTIATSKDKEYSVKANYKLSSYYLATNDSAKAKAYSLAAVKDKNNSSSDAIGALYNLVNISMQEKDNKAAENYVLDMKKRTAGKDPMVLELSGRFNQEVKKDLVMAESEYTKAAALAPKILRYQADLLEVYEIKKDEAMIAKTISAMKVINQQVTNQEIAKYFEARQGFELANKYFIKSIVEDKSDSSKLLLGVMYYNLGKKDEGKQLITEAQKAGIKEADQVLADIKKEEAATTPSTQTTPKTNKK